MSIPAWLWHFLIFGAVSALIMVAAGAMLLAAGAANVRYHGQLIYEGPIPEDPIPIDGEVTVEVEATFKEKGAIWGLRAGSCTFWLREEGYIAQSDSGENPAWYPFMHVRRGAGAANRLYLTLVSGEPAILRINDERAAVVNCDPGTIEVIGSPSGTVRIGLKK